MLKILILIATSIIAVSLTSAASASPSSDLPPPEYTPTGQPAKTTPKKPKPKAKKATRKSSTPKPRVRTLPRPLRAVSAAAPAHTGYFYYGPAFLNCTQIENGLYGYTRSCGWTYKYWDGATDWLLLRTEYSTCNFTGCYYSSARFDWWYFRNGWQYNGFDSTL